MVISGAGRHCRNICKPPRGFVNNKSLEETSCATHFDKFIAGQVSCSLRWVRFFMRWHFCCPQHSSFTEKSEACWLLSRNDNRPKIVLCDKNKRRVYAVQVTPINREAPLLALFAKRLRIKSCEAGKLLSLCFSLHASHDTLHERSQIRQSAWRSSFQSKDVSLTSWQLHWYENSSRLQSTNRSSQESL